MKGAMEALDQIASKVGFAAALLVAWLFFQVQDLNSKVEALESKIEDIGVIKQDIASIKSTLDLILKYNLKEYNNVRAD